MILGAVLAGGTSSRFGSNKALARLSGRTLLDHARTMVASHCDRVIVVGEANGGLPDLPAPGLGPLGGIAAALEHARSHGFDSVLTIGCDMPEVPGALVEALIRRAPAYCSDAPVLGHWPSALSIRLYDHLQGAAPAGARSGPARTGERSRALSVRGWAEAIGALPIAAPVPLRNVNAPADLLPA